METRRRGEAEARRARAPRRQTAQQAENALLDWLETLPGEAFVGGAHPLGEWGPEDLRPAWQAVWTRKRRAIRRKMEEERETRGRGDAE